MFTTTSAFDLLVQQTLINAMVAGPGVLEAVEIGLINQQVQITKNSMYADIPQPSFAGYALATGAFSHIVADVRGLLVAQADPVFFTPTAATAGDTIWGYFVTNAAKYPLFGWEYFPEPVALMGTFTRLGLVAEICLASPPNGQVQTIT